MEPVVLAAGEGEEFRSSIGSRIVVKADLPAIVLAELRWTAGSRGPDRHVHRQHADCFRVLQGALTMEIGPDAEEVRVEPGDFALVPPGVAHTFRNDEAVEAVFVNIHAPNGGFGESLRGNRDGADQFPPPEDGGRPASEVLVRRAGEGQRLEAGASHAQLKAEVSDGIGSVSLSEMTLAPGFPGPSLHRHARTADMFWVLEGSLTVTLGERAAEAGPGSFVLIPPGQAHTVANPGGVPARVLNVMAPAGAEQYLKELAAAEAAGGAALPPDETASIAARYDFEEA